MTVAFGRIFGSVNAFNSERAVFIRERLSNAYDTTSYFVGRTVATLPALITPVLLLAICYFAIHLNNTAGIFFFTKLSACLVSWMSAASFCLP
jgi:hypothetical protein